LTRNAQSGCMKPFRRLIAVSQPVLDTGTAILQGSCHAPPCGPLQCCTPQGTDVPTSSNWSELPQLHSMGVNSLTPLVEDAAETGTTAQTAAHAIQRYVWKLHPQEQNPRLLAAAALGSGMRRLLEHVGREHPVLVLSADRPSVSFRDCGGTLVFGLCPPRASLFQLSLRKGELVRYHRWAGRSTRLWVRCHRWTGRSTRLCEVGRAVDRELRCWHLGATRRIGPSHLWRELHILGGGKCRLSALATTFRCHGIRSLHAGFRLHLHSSEVQVSTKSDLP
jgi:hypothetical protein